MTWSVHLLVDRLVGLFVIISLSGGKLHFMLLSEHLFFTFFDDNASLQSYIYVAERQVIFLIIIYFQPTMPTLVARPFPAPS